MPDEQREGSRASLGILATGALVVGGIIGTGIFAVPAAVAKFGWVAYPAFVVVTAGSILLAVTFAELARLAGASAKKIPRQHSVPLESM